MRLARDGYRYILISSSLTLIASLLSPYLGIPLLLITLVIIYFFRDPDRIIPENPDHFLAPADGKITHIGTEVIDNIPYHHIVIFLSVFNVHINRLPCSGTVMSVTHTRGLFKPAFDPDIGHKNERMHTVLDTSHGLVHVVQLAGLIARRIICRLTSGDKVNQGDRFGMIKFSSRTDLYVPKATTDICVTVKQSVTGGISVLAQKK